MRSLPSSAPTVKPVSTLAVVSVWSRLISLAFRAMVDTTRALMKRTILTRIHLRQKALNLSRLLL